MSLVARRLLLTVVLAASLGAQAASSASSAPATAHPRFEARVVAVYPGFDAYNPEIAHQGIPVEVVRFRLVHEDPGSYHCNVVVRRHGRVVGRVAMTGSIPTRADAPPGWSARSPLGVSVNLSVRTFHGSPRNATVRCSAG